MEVWGLKIRYSGLIGIILLALLASISLGLSQDSPSLPVDLTMNGTDDAGMASGGNNTSVANSVTDSIATAAPPNVQGIWKVSLAGVEIIMALNQSGESLFGVAKSEGDLPWNGAVAGSLSGGEIHISLASMPDKVLTSTYLSGTVEGDSITGSYVRSDSSGSAARGRLTATMISSDTSAYTPAAVETVQEPAPAESAPQITSTAESANPEQSTVQEKKSKFRDVTELAKGIDPNILPRMASL
jgi:hypothetical protein